MQSGLEQKHQSKAQFYQAPRRMEPPVPRRNIEVKRTEAQEEAHQKKLLEEAEKRKKAAEKIIIEEIPPQPTTRPQSNNPTPPSQCAFVQYVSVLPKAQSRATVELIDEESEKEKLHLQLIAFIYQTFKTIEEEEKAFKDLTRSIEQFVKDFKTDGIQYLEQQLQQIFESRTEDDTTLIKESGIYILKLLLQLKTFSLDAFDRLADIIIKSDELRKDFFEFLLYHPEFDAELSGCKLSFANLFPSSLDFFFKLIFILKPYDFK